MEDREIAKMAQKSLRVKIQAMRNLGKAKEGKAKLPRVERVKNLITNRALK